MAWSSSMLFTLKAPSAYLPFRALAKRSVVCVSGIVSCSFWGRDPGQGRQQGPILGSDGEKETKNLSEQIAAKRPSLSTCRITGQLAVKRGEADAQQFGGFLLVAAGVGQCPVEVVQFLFAQEILQRFQRHAAGGHDARDRK